MIPVAWVKYFTRKSVMCDDYVVSSSEIKLSSFMSLTVLGGVQKESKTRLNRVGSPRHGQPKIITERKHNPSYPTV